MNRVRLSFVFAALMLSGTLVQAAIITVSGPNSNLGFAPEIIAAPSDALDDDVVNSGMQGFNEAQAVTTSMAYGLDGGGTLAAGSFVDSHMIFLNTAGGTLGTHGSVIWTFGGAILGIMSDSGGNLEAASTPELGAPGTNYTMGPGAPPFGARGLESNNGTGIGANDGYQIIAPNQLRVSMRVTEPGDWIRVVTAPVPEPSTWVLILLGASGIVITRRRRPRD